MEDKRESSRGRGPKFSTPTQTNTDFSPYQEWRPVDENNNQTNNNAMRLPDHFWLGVSCRQEDSKLNCWSLSTGIPVDLAKDIQASVEKSLKGKSDTTRVVAVGINPVEGTVVGARAVMTTKFSRRAAMEVLSTDPKTGLSILKATPNAGETPPRFSMVEVALKPRRIGITGKIAYPKSAKPTGDAFESVSRVELPRNADLPTSKSIHLLLKLSPSTKGISVRDLSNFISVVDAGGNKLPIGFHTTNEGAMITINKSGFEKMSEIRFEAKDPSHYRLGGYLFYTEQRYASRP